MKSSTQIIIGTLAVLESDKIRDIVNIEYFKNKSLHKIVKVWPCYVNAVYLLKYVILLVFEKLLKNEKIPSFCRNLIIPLILN